MTTQLDRRIPLQPFSGQSYGIPLLPYCAQLLHAKRDDQGLSCEKLGVLTGIAGNTIAAFERGVNWPTMLHFLHLAEALSVSPEALWPPNPAAQLPADPEHPLCRILQLLRPCPLPMLQSLLVMLENVVPLAPLCYGSVLQP
jgi:transcriptional regulator with XRE-family HTH domain